MLLMLEGVEAIGLIVEAIVSLAAVMCELLVVLLELAALAVQFLFELLVAIFSRDRAAKMRQRRLDRSERMKKRRTAAIERFRARRRRRIQRVVQWTMAALAVAGGVWLYLWLGRLNERSAAEERARIAERASEAKAAESQDKKKPGGAFRLNFDFRKKKDESAKD